jgi:protein O-mannosyl-transferase
MSQGRADIRWRTTIIGAALVTLTWLTFGQTLRHEFVNYDDNAYVYQNPTVIRGLTLDGIVWACTHVHSGNWHPLTSISHMLDCQLYGLKAGGHHFTNVLLHSIAVLLLFLVLRRMTAAFWRSAFVAALFAIHPLRVESVAWVAERKDVLSGVFFMLTVWAYVSYVRNPPSLVRYIAAVALFALGLISKPSLVTVPILLLLLDYWPLGRFEETPTVQSRQDSWWYRRSLIQRMILEKIPLLVLSAGSSLATVMAQRHTMSSIELIPLAWRVKNAAVSYCAYIWQMFWPARLAVFYPHPQNTLPSWETLLALAFLVGISAAAFLLRRDHRYLFVGWFWYLGMLVPMIGLIQVGGHARADRYTYLPQIGLYVIISWGAAAISTSWSYRREILSLIGIGVIGALTWRTWEQTKYWQRSESLWTHTLAVTSDTDIAHNALGEDLLKRGHLEEAAAHFQTAVRIRPSFRDAESNLGVSLLQQGKIDDAIAEFEKVLMRDPKFAKGYFDMGAALLQKKELEEAIAQFRKAIELRSDYAEAHNNLAIALFQTERSDEAITHWETSVAIDGDNAEAHNNLAVALIRKGRVPEAIAHWRRTLQLEPDRAGAQLSLAWVLATCPEASSRDGSLALVLAQRAQRSSGNNNPMMFRTLAAAYAEIGQFTEAIAAATQGLRVATAAGSADLTEALNRELGLYQAGRPFRDSSLSANPSP